ncbi:unnamed protein product (macronuclear) [Paramecium tetraurelia]|uniref:Uncharacterized protein n=1 Tax=Paramecium tetraurelia TaxID=5888 RepID=A0BH77_PARTE|nr:uncharacterized protein GSPATT00028929001 [Paramecium tetraurelia]CAK57894.1 unnamed protein product [Paramecium tetraurelia]|eukprot:XP_001425292.1 hypothetical protein (macronuclear) [Paramecium tetraurelia strain d4-2]
MFQRIATNLFRQPIFQKQLQKFFIAAPVLGVLTNHNLLIQNLSYLQSQFYHMEESNDELELLRKFQSAQCNETSLMNSQTL